MDPIEALRIRGIGIGKKLVGDAQAGDVRAGKTFSNAQGNDNTGTLPVRSTVAQTVTPGVNNIIKQAGIYDGDITIQGDVNLVAANILSGKSIFGVSGTLQVGKKMASGTVTPTSTTSPTTVTGLAFTPSVVVINTGTGVTNNPSALYLLVDTNKGAKRGASFGGINTFVRHALASNGGNSYLDDVDSSTNNKINGTSFSFLAAFAQSHNWWAYE